MHKQEEKAKVMYLSFKRFLNILYLPYYQLNLLFFKIFLDNN